MRTPTRLATALLFGCVLTTTAVAQSAPQIPNPTNPYPANPIATDGTSLLTGHRLGRGVAATRDRYGNAAGGFFALTPGY